MPGWETSFSTMASAPLASSFSRARAMLESISAAKAMTSVPGRCASGNAAQNVFGGLEVEVQRPSRRSFSGATAGMRKSATAAAPMTTVASGRCSMTAARISSALVTGTKAQPAGGVQRSGRGDQDDLRAALVGGLGEGVAHLAAGAVAEEADGIDRLAGASGGDKDGFAGEVLLSAASCEGGENRLGDGFDVGEAAGAGHAAGEIAAAGLDDGDAAGFEQLDVGARGGMVPHVHVHRRGDDDGRGGGEEHGGEKVVGEAVGHFGENVRGGGRDDDSVGGLRLGDVLDLAFIVEAGRRAGPARPTWW